MNELKLKLQDLQNAIKGGIYYVQTRKASGVSLFVLICIFCLWTGLSAFVGGYFAYQSVQRSARAQLEELREQRDYVQQLNDAMRNEFEQLDQSTERLGAAVGSLQSDAADGRKVAELLVEYVRELSRISSLCREARSSERGSNAGE